MIATETFVDEMTRRWLAYPQRAGHPRIVTPAVQKLWGQMCEIFNSQLHPDGGPRPVIATPLGSGKTTAMMLWSAMLPVERHPGVLLVVGTKAAANLVASTINDWVGADVAFAYHTGAPGVQGLIDRDLRDLADWPILVICHKGYEVSVDQFALADTAKKFDATHAFRSGRRQIVIVDEAMELVFQGDLSLRELQETLARVENMHAHRLAWKILNGFVDMILDAPPGRRHVIDAGRLLRTLEVSQGEADAAIVALWPDIKTKLRDHRERSRTRDRLARVRRHLAMHRWADDRTLMGGRVLLPPEAGLVVLDATATANAVYTSSPFYQVRDDLEGVRRYDAVDAYVIRGTGTGIKAMTRDIEEDGAQITRPTLELVLKLFGERASERRVLVVTNKDSEDFVRRIWSEAGFAALYVEHWENLDGRNDFVECDTLVTLTVPYGRPSHDVAVYQAVTGQELTSEELNDEPEDVKALREVRVAGQLAQAIGRLGPVRDLTRVDGQAEAAVVVHRLPLTPKTLRTDEVLVRIQRVLQGLQVHELGEQHYRDQVAIFGELFTTLGPLERPEHVSKRNRMRLLQHEGLRAHVAAAGLELVQGTGNQYVVQFPGQAAAVSSSVSALLAFVDALEPGQERPVKDCGLSEDARNRALRHPAVVEALAARGVTVDRRGPRAGGLVLVR